MENNFVVFVAPWCGPCSYYKKLILENKSMIEERGYKVMFIDVETHPDHPFVKESMIKAVPTTSIRKDGVIIATMIGAKSLSEILGVLK